jgi:hypothetical protein
MLQQSPLRTTVPADATPALSQRCMVDASQWPPKGSTLPRPTNLTRSAGCGRQHKADQQAAAQDAGAIPASHKAHKTRPSSCPTLVERSAVLITRAVAAQNVALQR